MFQHEHNIHFDLIIKELNNAFEYYRYANEKDEHVVLYENLLVLTIAVKDVAKLYLDKHPEFEEK